MKTKPDLCANDGDMLDWFHDSLSDSGRCPTCGEIWFEVEE